MKATNKVIHCFLLLLIFFICFNPIDGINIRINFNLQFKCGPYRGAEGRLFIRLVKGKLDQSYQPILEIVLDRESNGIFNRSVIVPANWDQPNSFELLFRTNCYIMNRFGECCAHDFKFIGYIYLSSPNKIAESWLYSKDYNRRESLSKKLNNCTFEFATRNPKTGQTVVDLRELLVDMDKFKENIFVSYRSLLGIFVNGQAIYTYRRCSPRDDDPDNEMLKNFEGSTQSWEICAHPNYGYYGPASFELAPRETKCYQ